MSIFQNRFRAKTQLGGLFLLKKSSCRSFYSFYSMFCWGQLSEGGVFWWELFILGSVSRGWGVSKRQFSERSFPRDDLLEEVFLEVVFHHTQQNNNIF